MDGYKDSNEYFPAGSGARNDANPNAKIPPYAPIPPDGKKTTYKWPLDGSEGYYSLMYVGKNPKGRAFTCARVHACLRDSALFSRALVLSAAFQ